MTRLPTTRYVGSKRKIANWIWASIESLQFDTFLDAMGGTGVIAYCAKLHRKKVTYNDILKHNYLTGVAVIENSGTTLPDGELQLLLQKNQGASYTTFVSDTFRDIYYTDEENAWLDMVISNIQALTDRYKQAIAYYALFQACLVKRPFNLFHRKNLYLRHANVKRGFGNKATWDTPFPVHFRGFVEEANALVFDNGKSNLALNLDVLDIPGSYDMVYLDPPYFSGHSNSSVDYRSYYHFLEGMANFETWKDLIDFQSGHRRLKPLPSPWLTKEGVYSSFHAVIDKFNKSTLVISYRSGGFPTEPEIVEMLEKRGKHVTVLRKPYKYALSVDENNELLFIAR